jgi:hypothetical protein
MEILIFTVGYLLFSNFIVKEKTYYIPQAKMYFKTISTKDTYGYVLFSHNRNLSLSDSIDYIKVAKNVSTNFLVDSDNNIYLICSTLLKTDSIGKLFYEKVSNINKIHNVNYTIIDGITESDTLFFEKRDRTNPLKIKDSYIEIAIYKNFNFVSITKYGDTFLTELEQIK